MKSKSTMHSVDTTKNKRKRRRTEDIEIRFVNGIASDWAFSIPDAFRDALDVKFLSYADSSAKAEGKTTSREVWTRGIPPVFSFAAGHIFYDPPSCRSSEWRVALKKLSRVVQVKEASPDQENGVNGWVLFEISYYKNCKFSRAEEKKVSQKEFAEFLKSGNLISSIIRPQLNLF